MKEKLNLRSQSATSKSSEEAAFIGDQLRRAFDGGAWHGPSLLELLADVDSATAAARPLKNVHTIWELVLHIEAWDRAALVRLSGKKCQPAGAENFPLTLSATATAWRKTVARVKKTHETLVKTVASLPEARLRDRVPGKRYNFHHMLHGIAQHELYHAGQIAVLMKR